MSHPMLAQRVDINELRNSALYKNRRYSLQRESSLELKRTVNDIKATTDGEKSTTETCNNNSNNEGGDTLLEPKAEEGIIMVGEATRTLSSSSDSFIVPVPVPVPVPMADDPPAVTASSNIAFSRSVSTNMVLRNSSSGLHSRPMSLSVMPRVIDIDTTVPEPESTTQNNSDMGGGADQQGGGGGGATGKKKKSKILSAVTGIKNSKLMGKFESAAAKLRREDKYKKESTRSSGDMSGYLSPREGSPDGTPSVLSSISNSSESIRPSRLSYSPTPHSPLLLSRGSPVDPSMLYGSANSLQEGIFNNGTTDDAFPQTEGDAPVRRGKKLEKFFGDDLPTNALDRKTALLEYEGDDEVVDIQEEGVVYNPRKKKGSLPVIKAATMAKLVERLTHPSESDPNFLNQYLLTYRSFTTPQGLLELLKARFDQVMEEGKETDNPPSVEHTPKNKQVIRLRLFNLIKSWLQHHWIDFQDEPELVAEVLKFSELITRDDMNMAAKNTLVRIVTKNTEGEKQKTLIFSTPPPKSYIPIAKEKLSLADIHPEEFARQITLLEYNIYKVIKPWELLAHTQGKKSANIVTMINQFNDLSKWVQTEILRSGETPKQRAVAFGKLLEICEHLKTLNNYNALMEIISGINASPIFRLKLTWAALGSKQLDSFNELNTLVSGNGAYKGLRNALHTTKPPCIPYMGMYLTDLTFINDGNPQYLEKGYINFDKCRRLSAVIQEIIQYQQTPYCLSYVDEIQQYLKNLEFERDDNKIYQLSLQLEERGSVRM